MKTEVAKLMTSSRITYESIRKGIKTRDLAEVVGCSYQTFLTKKKHPEKFTLGEIWEMEKFFGAIPTVPLMRKENK